MVFQVRPITPPPDSPPQRSVGRSRGSRHAARIEVETTNSVATSSHIENTVAQVAEEAAEYARTVDQVSTFCCYMFFEVCNGSLLFFFFLGSPCGFCEYS